MNFTKTAEHVAVPVFFIALLSLDPDKVRLIFGVFAWGAIPYQLYLVICAIGLVLSVITVKYCLFRSSIRPILMATIILPLTKLTVGALSLIGLVTMPPHYFDFLTSMLYLLIAISISALLLVRLGGKLDFVLAVILITSMLVSQSLIALG